MKETCASSSDTKMNVSTMDMAGIWRSDGAARMGRSRHIWSRGALLQVSVLVTSIFQHVSDIPVHFDGYSAVRS
jgi:hypothetical protein